MGFKTIKNAASDIVKTNIWKKFARPTVGRGKTAWQWERNSINHHVITTTRLRRVFPGCFFRYSSVRKPHPTQVPSVTVQTLVQQWRRRQST